MRKYSLKDTKNDILDGYNGLMTEFRKLENQLKAKERELLVAQNALQQTGAASVAATVATTGIVEMTSISGVIASLHSIQEGMSKAFSDNSAQQVVEAEQLERIQKQINEERNQIKGLYDVEIGENTLEELIDKYLQEKETFELSFELKKEKYATELDEKRNAWKKERDDYAVRLRERDQEAVKTRKRERDEYTYALQQGRATEDDGYAQKKKALDEALLLMRTEKEDAWALREKGVADQEKEYKDYADKFAGLDALLKKEIAKAEAEGKAIIERDHKVKMKMAQADNDSEIKALDLQIQALKDTIAKNEAQLKHVSEQLEAANKQTQSIALKKLELQMTANRESYTKIHELAMEQAKNSGKGK